MSDLNGHCMRRLAEGCAPRASNRVVLPWLGSPVPRMVTHEIAWNTKTHSCLRSAFLINVAVADLPAAPLRLRMESFKQ